MAGKFDTPSVLYEDNHLLGLWKPAHLATMGLPEGEPTLLEWARDYIKRKYNKPGNVYLGVVSRLDAPVTGVVLVARTSKAAARLTEQFKAHKVEKVYWAIVEGTVEPVENEWTDWVVRDSRHKRVHIAKHETPDAKKAILDYQRLKTFQQRSQVGRRGPRRGVDPTDERSLLEVRLKTGRKHQIRVQCAKHGHPILGDRKYGSDILFPKGIALHSRRVVVQHPTLKEPVEIVAPLPEYWPKLLG